MAEKVALDRLNQKDQAEFEKVFKRYHPMIYQYFLKEVGNVHDAEDLTSQVFESLWNKLEKNENPILCLVSWLNAVRRNKLADFLRKKYRQKAIFEDAFGKIERFEHDEDTEMERI